MEESTIIHFVSEYWQFVFLYLFKYLKEMNETLKKLEIDIIILKTENKTRRTTDTPVKI